MTLAAVLPSTEAGGQPANQIPYPMQSMGTASLGQGRAGSER